LIALLGLVGTLVLVIGVAGFFGSTFSIGHDAASLTTVGTLIVLTVGAAVLYGLVPLAGVRTWMWTYVTGLLVLSTLSCLLPFSVAALIFWVRDDCRNWFAAASKQRGPAVVAKEGGAEPNWFARPNPDRATLHDEWARTGSPAATVRSIASHSPDGLWWWSGSDWRPAVSLDGIWWWDGEVWRLRVEPGSEK
jgi:hypothetical protein